MTLNRYFRFTQPRPNPKFPRRTYYAMAPNDIWQLDLVDLSGKGKEGGVGSRGGVHKEEGVNLQKGKGGGGYILNVIDVYSRKAGSTVIQSKSGVSIMGGLKILFQQMGGQPHKIQSDKEAGLLSQEKELNKIGIQIYQVGNAYDGLNSAPIVERLNRTMNDYMYKTEVDNPDLKNIDISKMVADKFTKQYNETKHHTIKTTPNSAFNGTTPSQDVLESVFHTRDELRPEPKKQINKDLKVGSWVFIPLKASHREIEKKGADKWNRTPYRIEEITKTNPPQYRLAGLTQKYYKEQLRKATL